MMTYHDIYQKLNDDIDRLSLIAVVGTEAIDENVPISEPHFAECVRRFVDAAADAEERSARIEHTRRLAQVLRELGVVVYGDDEHKRTVQARHKGTKASAQKDNAATISAAPRRRVSRSAKTAPAAQAAPVVPRVAASVFHYYLPIENGVVHVQLRHPFTDKDAEVIKRVVSSSLSL